MRRTALQTAAVLAAVLLLCLVAVSAADLVPAQGTAPRVLVVGDSLAVGMRPFLGDLMGSDEVTWDAVSGRTTPDGLRALRGRLREARPHTIVISLGTNDGSDPARFTDRLRRVLSAAPAEACVVWAAVFRPPRKGAFRALNLALRAEARHDRRLVVVDWDRAVDRGRALLPDGLHPGPEGFLYRSRMMATAARSGCASRRP